MTNNELKELLINIEESMDDLLFSASEIPYLNENLDKI